VKLLHVIKDVEKNGWSPKPALDLSDPPTPDFRSDLLTTGPFLSPIVIHTLKAGFSMFQKHPAVVYTENDPLSPPIICKGQSEVTIPAYLLPLGQQRYSFISISSVDPIIDVPPSGISRLLSFFFPSRLDSRPQPSFSRRSIPLIIAIARVERFPELSFLCLFLRRPRLFLLPLGPFFLLF